MGTKDDLGESRRQRLWRWVKALGLSGLGLIALLMALVLGYRAYFLHHANARLNAITSQLDAKDPGWRWQDILKARKSVPAEQNGARHVLAAVQLMPRGWPMTPARPADPPNNARALSPWEQPSQPIGDRVRDMEPNETLPPDLVSVLRGELKALSPALAEARKLAGTPTGHFDVRWRVNFLETQLPHLQDLHRVADLLRYEALRQIVDGDVEGAFDSVRCMLHSGASAGDEPLLLTFLVRTACDEAGIAVLERALAHGQVKAATLVKMQQELRAESDEPLLVRGWRGERAAMARFLDAGARGDVMMAYAVDGDEQKAPWYSRVYDWLVIRPLARANEVPYLELTTTALHKLQQPREQWPAVYQWYSDTLADMHAQSPYGTLFVSLLASHLIKNAEADQRRAARLGCARVALALERYRLEHCVWPPSLDQLRPAFLESIPEDPYVGGPLHYRRMKDGVEVYSFGGDREDNGGTMDRANPRTPGTDIGFWLWDAAARGKK